MQSVFAKWNPSMAQVILFAVGAGLVFLGQEFGIPPATDVGIVLLGALMVAVGGDIAVKRLGVFRSEAWGQGHVVEAYRAVADLLWAVVLVIGGLAAAVILVKWFVPSAPEAFWQDLLTSTAAIAVFLGFAGVMIFVDGLIRAIVGSGSIDPRRFSGLAGIFDRAVGAATCIVGLGMAGIALALLFAPDTLRAALEQLNIQMGG